MFDRTGPNGVYDFKWPYFKLTYQARRCSTVSTWRDREEVINWKMKDRHKTMRLHTFITLAVASWLTLAAPAGAQPSVGGLSNCSLASLSGSYGYAISGFDGTTPVANYGLFTSNGSGSLSGSATLSGGGVISAVTVSGEYTLTPACTGTAVFQNSLGQVAHLAITINSNGGAIEFVETDSGTTVSGEARPLAATCDSTAYSGPYTYAVSGWLAFGGTFVPYADSGRVVPNGGGTLTGKSTYSSGGVVERRTLSGTYSLGSSCTGTSSITDSLGNTGTIAMTVVNNGQQILFLYTTPGSVVAGRAYRGQFSCSNSSVSGPFQYSISGFGVSPGVLVPVAYSGELTANGSGNIQGSDAISQNGVVNTRTIAANYSVNSDCSGTETVTDSLGNNEGLDFFVTDQGVKTEFVQTNSGLVISGEGQQVASGTCTASTADGAYGYATEGWFYPGGILAAVADAGQYTSDGAGHFSGATTTSYAGTIEPRTLSGTYTTNSDCSGTSTFTDSLGNTAHFRSTISPDGQQIYSIETDAGTVITSIARQQFDQPAAAIVNGANFAANSVAPGSLISIFGAGLASGVAQASGAPWPTQLGNTTVSVNGTAIPVYYVSATQINAQLPVNLTPGPAQLSVSVGGISTGSISFTVSAAAPGIFTYGAFLRAIAVDFTGNPLGTLVGPSTPAHAGDELVVYLTGGGAVKTTSGTWTTGALSPPGLSSVTLPYTVTLGGLPATTAYLGLTTGFIGLYQLNVQVPSGLPAGDHTLVINVNGKASSSALVSVSP
jgi:uncharacterized protein (TIGR03437 family)